MEAEQLVVFLCVFLLTIYTRSNRKLCSAFDMLAIEEQRATCNLLCVKNCYFPHAGNVSTEHLRSSSVSNDMKAIKAVTAFLTVPYLARVTIANVTKRLLRKIESR